MKEERRNGCGWLAVYVAAVAGLLIAMCSCTRTVYVAAENERERTDTVRMAASRVDSVIIRDSVAVEHRGDTVEVTRWRDRYRVKILADTVYSSVRDSVILRIPCPVERELTRWERVRMDFGGLALGGLAAAVIIGAIIVLRKINRQ